MMTTYVCQHRDNEDGPWIDGPEAPTLPRAQTAFNQLRYLHDHLRIIQRTIVETDVTPDTVR